MAKRNAVEGGAWLALSDEGLLRAWQHQNAREFIRVGRRFSAGVLDVMRAELLGIEAGDLRRVFHWVRP